MRKLRINNIRLVNFKNLGECRLETKNITTIVGANNSGKSNFLEIFTFLKHLLVNGASGVERIRMMFGGLQMKEFGTPSILEIDYDFSNQGQSFFNCLYKIEFSFNEKNFEIISEIFDCKELNKKGPHRRLIDRQKDVVILRGESKERKILRTQSVIDLIRTTFPKKEDLPENDFVNVAGVGQIASTNIFNVHSIENYNALLRKKYAKLFVLQEEENEKFQQFQNWFCKILDLKWFKVHRIEIPEMKDEFFHFGFVSLHGMHNQIHRLEDTSDGTKVMFLMLYDILIENKSIIVIDEPEIGLHPKAIATFLDLFLNNVIDKQLLFTTHSTFILNYLSPDFIHVIEKNEEGSSYMIKATEIENMNERLKSRYVNFGDMFAGGFKTQIDTTL